MSGRRAAGPLSNPPTREECEALCRRVLDAAAPLRAQVEIESYRGGRNTFARGDTHLAIDDLRTRVKLSVSSGSGAASVRTVQLDDRGIQALVASAREAASEWRGPATDWSILLPQTYPTPLPRDFESVPDMMDGNARQAVCRHVLERSAASGVITGGGLYLTLGVRAMANSNGLYAYNRVTRCELSLTARTKDGTGSGAASEWQNDWARLGWKAVVERAIDTAKRSANPVAVEPGRYTVILEPNALSNCLGWITWSAVMADLGYSAFSKDPRGSNKLGLQMIDRRLNFVSNPWDPDMPTGVIDWDLGDPITKPVRWFERGVLRQLAYSRKYAEKKGREPVFAADNLRVTGIGTPTSFEEMVATTKRGLWINELSSASVMNNRALMLSGTTRNGTFLIENGKITKAVKNFRFTESPFFVLNRLEAFGEPERTPNQMMVPRVKVRDFDFTSLTDAI